MITIPADHRDESTTAIAGRATRAPRLPKRQAPTEYFETLNQGVKAWYEHLKERAVAEGYTVAEEPEFAWEPMYAGQNQSRFYQLTKVGKATFTRLLSIYVYRLDSGRYEVMGYLS